MVAVPDHPNNLDDHVHAWRARFLNIYTPWSNFRVKAFYLEVPMKIGDLAKRAGCTVETIRYYEREGLLPKPERGANNYRLYDSSHLKSLCFIRNCRAFEMALEEIKTLLNLKLDPGKDCSEVNMILEEHIVHVTNRISMLENLRAQLTSLRNLCHRIQPREACAILLELAEPVEDVSLARRDVETHVHGTHCSQAKRTT